MKNFDIVVVGGGASGLTAAISAKMTNPSLNVVVVEKLSRVGKKILATGNGKCNISNTSIAKDNYHGSIYNYMEILNNTTDTEEFFNSLGVLCTTDSMGRIYPYSRHSATILNGLRFMIDELGVEIICDYNVQSFSKNGEGLFEVCSETETILAKRIILASGGYAAPTFGTDGYIMRKVGEMGHVISKIYPAIAPLKTSRELLKGLKGLRVNAEVTAIGDNEKLKTEIGEVQFNEDNLSGICIFNLSYLASEYEGELSVHIDLMPQKSYQEVVELLRNIIKIKGNLPAEELLTGIFHKNLALYIMKRNINLDSDLKVEDIAEKSLISIAAFIKSMKFRIMGSATWDKAQTTSGGINGESVTTSLESENITGMYFAGELLDIDGDCGGYNLAWAWASGLWAGRKCVESLGLVNDKN